MENFILHVKEKYLKLCVHSCLMFPPPVPTVSSFLLLGVSGSMERAQPQNRRILHVS